MASIPPLESLSLSLLRPTTTVCSSFHHQLPCLMLSQIGPRLSSISVSRSFIPSVRLAGSPRSITVAAASTLMANSVPSKNGVYIVGDFMTKKEELHVVKPTTTVDEALEALVENRITGFPVIDEDWKLVGLVSDYDLLALDSISGSSSLLDSLKAPLDAPCVCHADVRASKSALWELRESSNGEEPSPPFGCTTRADTNMFPEVDSTWKTFNEVQKLLSKTNGKMVGDLMTPAPIVVRESTNLEDAARLLLETKYRRLPVVDGDGKLVGIITRGNVVRAALQIKREMDV